MCGLCQSPKNWHSAIDAYVTKPGFKPPKSDPRVYVYCTGDDTVNNNTVFTSKELEAMLTLHVDDRMLAGKNKAVFQTLRGRFATTNMFRHLAGTGDASHPRLREQDAHRFPSRLHQVIARKVGNGGV